MPKNDTGFFNPPGQYGGQSTNTFGSGTTGFDFSGGVGGGSKPWWLNPGSEGSVLGVPPPAGATGVPGSGGNNNTLGLGVGTGGNNSSLTGGVLPFYQGAYNNQPGFNLINTFGTLGPYLASLIQSGGYNPQVFQALVNQLQPQIDRGVATIGANTGAGGTRFGSGYDLALGDYLSQVNLNEQGLAANLYENAVQTSLSALGLAAGPASQYKSNQGGFLTSLLTSLIGAGGGALAGTLGGGGFSGSGGGFGLPTSNSGSIPTIGTDYGSNSYGTAPVLGLPGTVGTPNASDPFGNAYDLGGQSYGGN